MLFGIYGLYLRAVLMNLERIASRMILAERFDWRSRIEAKDSSGYRMRQLSYRNKENLDMLAELVEIPLTGDNLTDFSRFVEAGRKAGLITLGESMDLVGELTHII
jgi:hypothetical protein